MENILATGVEVSICAYEMKDKRGRPARGLITSMFTDPESFEIKAIVSNISLSCLVFCSCSYGRNLLLLSFQIQVLHDARVPEEGKNGVFEKKTISKGHRIELPFEEFQVLSPVGTASLLKEYCLCNKSPWTIDLTLSPSTTNSHAAFNDVGSPNATSHSSSVHGDTVSMTTYNLDTDTLCQLTSWFWSCKL